MSHPDQSKLPIRMPAFKGVQNRTLDGSQPDWEAIGHVEPPDGAPNVLVVLIDDTGFGNPATFGGPIATPNYTRMADEGLRFNRRVELGCPCGDFTFQRFEWVIARIDPRDRGG